MSLQHHPNPFQVGGSNNTTHNNSSHNGPIDSTRISKELLQEIRRGDTAMAEDLVALAPHSGRAFRPGGTGGSIVQDKQNRSVTPPPAATSSAHAAAAGSVNAGTGAAAGGVGYSVSVHDTMTASDFVKQKREVGLVRMSLATKKAEIRKLDEQMDRAEKRLRQQQEQLTNTQEKFNNFLKFSNLEQDAAVRRADDETRAKHAKTLEIKKLSALINHAELETRKTRLQVENCVAYKEFLESLAKTQWFYDVLIRLRLEDKQEEILLAAEEEYQKRAGEARQQYEERAAARQALVAQEELDRQRKTSNSKGESLRSPMLRGRRSSSGAFAAEAAASAAATASATELPLEVQLDALHDAMEVDARAAIAAAEAAITKEVSAMSLAAVKHALHHEYEESRLPMCFASVDELLEVFISVEEGNLFLIQNCQELEEELEGISIGFMEEKAEMSTMVAQRTGQLTVLANSIAEAQERLKALDERIAALDARSGGGGVAAASSEGAGAGRSRGSPASGGTDRLAGGSGGGGGSASQNLSAADLSPEELKVRIENSIAHMFEVLSTGDQLLKGTLSGDGHGGGMRSSTIANSSGGSRHVGGGSAPPVRGARSNLNSAVGTKKAAEATSPGLGSTSTRKTAPNNSTSKTTSSTAKQRQQTQQQQQQQHQSDASMGPVEMLTIVENKLEEYHRYLTAPANHVDVALVQAVMKQSDKQRRRRARLMHLASQEQEQEERIKRALERSQAPIAHRTGKPVRPRSHVQTTVDEKTQRKAVRAAAAMDGSGTSIDSDEDGAEFFK